MRGKDRKSFQITQHNCARSSLVMQSLLNTLAGKTDIILLQEPWIFQDNQSTITHPAFNSIIPASQSQHSRPRVLAFISKTTELSCNPRPDIYSDLDVQVLEISAKGL